MPEIGTLLAMNALVEQVSICCSRGRWFKFQLMGDRECVVPESKIDLILAFAQDQEVI